MLTHHIPSYIVHYMDDTLEMQSHSGFEVYCRKAGKPTWMESFVLKAVSNFVIIDHSCGAGNPPSHVRYIWREDPCVFKKCAVNSGDLPSLPFILPVRH